MSKQLNRDLLSDAIGKIDPDYLDEFEMTDARLMAKRPHRSRYLRAFLISAACLVLVLALLLCSLPLTYIVFREPINHAVSEAVDRVLFTPDKGDGDIPGAFWVHWPLTDMVFDALGAGTDHSVIESMQKGDSKGLVPDAMKNFGVFLGRMYQYYLEYDLTDETVGEVIQGTQTDVDEWGAAHELPEITSIHGVMLHLYFNEQTGGFEYWVSAINGTWSEIYIPSEYKGVPVTTIQDEAFKGNKQLKTVRMSDSITTIGNSAFENCIALESVEFPAELQSIGERAFRDCFLLGSVEIGSTKLEQIGAQAFENCSALQRLSIPESAVSIGDYAFAYCSILEEIELEKVTYIGDGAFEKCKGLKKIKLPGSLTKIGITAFANCELLQKVVLPNESALTSIGMNAFANCVSLESVDLPKGLKTIEYGAFYECTSLESVVIPGTVETVGKGAFYQCSALQSVIMEDGDAENCDLVIGAQAFAHCQSLSEIRLPNTLVQIQTTAFYNVRGITELTLPENLESVYETAIYDCTNLQTLIITNPNTVYVQNAIASCPNLKTVIYCDTQQNWFKASSGFSLEPGTVIQCTDGTIVTE